MMDAPDSRFIRSGPRIPAEVLLTLGATLGIFIVVASGSMIASYAPEHSPWLFMASFAGPTAVVFAIYWLISRRL